MQELLETAKAILTPDANERAQLVHSLCDTLQSLSVSFPEPDQQDRVREGIRKAIDPQRPELNHTQDKNRLSALLRLIATHDVDSRVRTAAISVPCVAHDSLLAALKDTAFDVRSQAIETIVQAGLLDHVSISDAVRVLDTIAMEPDVGNIVHLLGLLQGLLSAHKSKPVAIRFEKRHSSDDAINHSLSADSADAILAQVTLLSEHESDKVRAAVATAISTVTQLQLVGVDKCSLATSVMQVLRNLSQDPSLLVVRAAVETLLSTLHLASGARHYAQLRNISPDQMLALLSLHGGRAASVIGNVNDARLVIRLLNCSRCQSFQTYCLAVTFLRRRLYCSRLGKDMQPSVDLTDSWTESLHKLAEHHPHFETIYLLQRNNSS